MRTLHFGLRVADLTRSLVFYTGLGYEAIGTVPETEFGSLTMLKLPAGHPDGMTQADMSGQVARD